MSLGDPSRRLRVEEVRCPAVKGLPEDIYHMLHHSFVDILKMRRSIEKFDALIEASVKTIHQSRDLLERISGFQPATVLSSLPKVMCVDMPD